MPTSAAGHLAPDGLGRPAVGEQEVVGDAQGLGGIVVAGGVVPLLVAEGGDAPGLVVGHPVADPVAQPPRDDRRVLHEGLGRVALGPAAAVLQRLGQVPVVQGREGLDAGLQQAVHQGVVEIEAGVVDRAPSRRAGCAARRWRSGRRPGRAIS